MPKNPRRFNGFTLIELLVVIAVLGVLAATVLLAINPLEQLRRSRDSSRQSAVTQLGRALQGYFTANNAIFPAQSTSAIGVLTTTGDLKTLPVNPSYSTTPSVTCAAANLQSTTSPVSNYCYLLNAAGTDAIIYVRMEANLNNNKCSSTSNIAWFVFSTATGKAGIFCKATEPASADITSSMTQI